MADEQQAEEGGKKKSPLIMIIVLVVVILLLVVGAIIGTLAVTADRPTSSTSTNGSGFAASRRTAYTHPRI